MGVAPNHVFENEGCSPETNTFEDLRLILTDAEKFTRALRIEVKSNICQNDSTCPMFRDV